MPNDTDPAIIRLNNVRLSYPKLFKAEIPKGKTEEKDAKYGATFILQKKEHAELIKEIETKIARVALNFFNKKVTLKHVCLHDGNEAEETDGYGDEVMFVRTSLNKYAKDGSINRLVLVDKKRETVTAEDGILYAGCYVNANFNLFAYDHETGGKGVSAQLRAVQFFKDGPSFGAGNVKAENEFEVIEESTDLDDF